MTRAAPWPVYDYRRGKKNEVVGYVSCDDEPQRVNIEENVWVPRRYWFDTRVGAADVRMVYEVRDGRTVCTEVRVTNHNVTPPLFTEIRRQMSAWELLVTRAVMQSEVRLSNGLRMIPAGGWLGGIVPNPEGRTATAAGNKLRSAPGKRGRPPTRTPEWWQENVVAHVLQAEAEGADPRVRVAKACGFELDTAENAISQARRKKLLPPAKPRTKGTKK